MGITDFQTYLESNASNAVVNVDLLQIARGSSSGYSAREASLSLVVDAESCLDRLYGGYYTDWVCGGQWSRMLNYITNLSNTCHECGLQLIVFFNGTLDKCRTNAWTELQIQKRRRVNNVLRHLNNKSTPPPKVWWMPPAGLVTALKFALQQRGISVATSVDDHHQEVINFIRSNRFHGLVAYDAIYAIFDPPRYFSSESLKLTFKGSLETKEYIMDEVARQIDLNPDRFCVLAALLGESVSRNQNFDIV